jgi:hypothetical protein
MRARSGGIRRTVSSTPTPEGNARARPGELMSKPR